MFKLLLCFVFLGLFVSNSQAISLRFTLDIISSGPSIYACGAGIKHEDHGGERICYDRISGENCSPARDCTNDEEPCNCVCTGGLNSGAGEVRYDQLVAEYTDWVDNGEQVGEIEKGTKMAKNNWSTLFNENRKEEWGKMLRTLEFRLSSERYGAEMFLDVCYRGPQIDFYENNDYYHNAGGYPNFYFRAHASITDLTTNPDTYQNLSKLKVRMEAVCDVQGEGRYPRVTEDQVRHTIKGITGGDKFFDSGEFVRFNSSVRRLYDGWINNGNTHAPRFCKVRYYFKESIRDSDPSLEHLRKWKLQKARVCTYTEINEK